MALVSRISISPVKGLQLVHPEQVRLELTGVLENRRFHIVDTAGRRYNQLRNGTLVRIRQEYDVASERLALTFPDGTVADGVVALGDEVTTDFYGRPVTGRFVEGPWTVALSRWAGRPLRLVQSPPGGRRRSQARSCLADLEGVARGVGTERRTRGPGRRSPVPHAPRSRRVRAT